MNVSFGQKIPIALGQIQNRKTGEFEQATIYEVDCKDEHDIIEARNDSKGWSFPTEFATNMHCKHVTHKQYNKNNDSSFYILQNQDYNTLGRIQIDNEDDEIYTVEWFDTKANNGYRFVGQTLLATAAKEVLHKNGSTLAVLGAVEDAIPFYTDVCQFQELGKQRFYMDKNEIKDFIKRTEKRTNATLIDLKA